MVLTGPVRYVRTHCLTAAAGKEPFLRSQRSRADSSIRFAFVDVEELLDRLSAAAP